MTMQIVPFQAESLLTWAGLLDAFEAGHRLPKPDTPARMMQEADRLRLAISVGRRRAAEGEATE